MREIKLNPDQTAIIQGALTFAEENNNYKIQNNDDLELSAELLKTVKVKFKEIDALHKSFVQPIKESIERINRFFSPVKLRCQDIEYKIKSEIMAYRQTLERARREEELRIKKELEAQMIKEQKALERKVKLAEKAGNTERVEKINAQIETIKDADVPAVRIESKMPDIAGVSFRKTWKARVINEDILPRKFLIPNIKMLNDFAKATKGQIQVEGVEFYPEEITSART